MSVQNAVGAQSSVVERCWNRRRSSLHVGDGDAGGPDVDPGAGGTGGAGSGDLGPSSHLILREGHWSC